MPISRKRVPSSSFASRSRPARKMRSARSVGRVEPDVPRAQPELARSSASARRCGRRALPLQPRRRPAPTVCAGSEAARPRAARSLSKVVSAEMLFAFRSGRDDAIVLAAGQAGEPDPDAAVALCESRVRRSFCRSAMRVEPVAREPLLHRLADAPDDRHRLRCEEGNASPPVRSPRSRAACRDRRRSWPETCCG